MSKSPVDRDAFYDSADDEWNDDGTEYELEPPDAEVLASEQARASELVRSAADSARVEELFKGPEQLTTKELLEDLPKFEFKFKTKHMLIAMTVLAVGLTLSYYLRRFEVLLVLVFIILAGAYAYMNYREHQHREQWYAERTKLAERQRGERGERD